MHQVVAACLAATVLLAGCTSPEAIVNAGDDAPAGPSGTPGADAPGTTPARKGDSAHTHDYWYGATSTVLLDETVPVMVFHNHAFDEPPREQHTHGCEETLASDSQGGSRKFSLPPGNIVLPGTETLEFLIEWNAPGITGLKLLYRPANTHDPIDAGPVTSGQNVHISLLPEMADAGHATRSQWVFFLCAYSDTPLDIAEGEVHTNLLALRAPVLPLEPAHPDLWGDNTTRPLSQARFTGTTLTAANKGENVWLQLPIAPGAIVPPGTTQVRILINATSQGEGAALTADNLVAYYRDSSIPEWAFKIADAAPSEAADFVFEITADHDMVDGIYAYQTNWELWLRLASDTRLQTPAGLESAPFVFQGTLEVDTFAVRGAEAAAERAADGAG